MATRNLLNAGRGVRMIRSKCNCLAANLFGNISVG